MLSYLLSIQYCQFLEVRTSSLTIISSQQFLSLVHHFIDLFFYVMLLTGMVTFYGLISPQNQTSCIMVIILRL
jgi:hypothetical protein